MLGCSLMEYLVLACYFKALNICKAIVGSVGVVEVNFHGVPYNLHLLEGHAFAEESFHSVGLTECLEGKTFAYRLFLTRVNLFHFVWVHQILGAYDATVRDNLCCIKLLLAKSWSPVSIDVSIMIRSYLDKVEW